MRLDLIGIVADRYIFKLGCSVWVEEIIVGIFKQKLIERSVFRLVAVRDYRRLNELDITAVVSFKGFDSSFHAFQDRVAARKVLRSIKLLNQFLDAIHKLRHQFG